MNANLFEGSFGSEEFVEKADRDAKHGGQSQTPANGLPPPWVHIHIVVGQRLVVHQMEQEDTLYQGGDQKTQFCWVLSMVTNNIICKQILLGCVNILLKDLQHTTII